MQLNAYTDYIYIYYIVFIIIMIVGELSVAKVNVTTETQKK